MVVGAFPAAKLGVLALKQISKPIANIIKDRAKQNPFFKRWVCMPPAQFYNWMEVKTKMWVMNLGKPMKVPQLNEAMAIELGANLLGEFIIFTIGASLLIFEYVRQSNKEVKKEEQIKQEKADLLHTINEMAFRIEKQDAQLREVTRILADIESRSWISRKLKPAAESNVLKEEQIDENNNNCNSNDLKNYSGNYNPERGFLFKALNMIENEVFYREQTKIENTRNSNGTITNALIYLGYL